MARNLLPDLLFCACYWQGSRPPSGDVPPALSGPALAREGRYAVRLGGEVVPAYALRGRVYIPVGRLSALGATVVWDQSERAVRVTLPGR